jgi:hypothetical protein
MARIEALRNAVPCRLEKIVLEPKLHSDCRLNIVMLGTAMPAPADLALDVDSKG